MEATTLLVRLRAAGLIVRRNGDQLVVGPKEKLTDALRTAIRDAKGELLIALDLTDRIRRMAKRWGFSSEELAEELNRAAADPTKALLWVEHDEWKFGAGETRNVRH